MKTRDESLVVACIAIGSNLGDREGAIIAAITAVQALPRTQVIAVSRLIETEPVGPPGQGPYLNGAMAITTALPPRELLERLLGIERVLGRTRSAEQQWGPRTIDLDLLLYGDLIVDEPGLTVPHPRMHERRFVLDPLVEIAAETRHPILGCTIQQLHRSLCDGADVG